MSELKFLSYSFLNILKDYIFIDFQIENSIILFGQENNVLLKLSPLINQQNCYPVFDTYKTSGANQNYLVYIYRLMNRLE